MTIETKLPTLRYGDPWSTHAEIRAARGRAPIALGPAGPEVLTYELAHTVLRDRRFATPRALLLELQGVTSGLLWERTVAGILSLDGDEHHRLRRLVAKAFTPAAARELESRMAEILTEVIDPCAAAGHCEAVAAVASPFPFAVICELLGAPRADWAQMAAWTEDLFKVFGFNIANDEPDITRAMLAIEAYADELIAQRRAEPRTDLVSTLVHVGKDGDCLRAEELRMLVTAVLSAGTDTTRNQVAAAIDVFCDHPEQWELLRAEPELAARAADEVVRYAPITFTAMRVACEDVELAGVVIPAGTIVLANTAAANRDPAVFPDPDRFDITRPDPAPALSFGGGIHYCLGVHLAKAELTAALATMAARMPGLHRTAPAPWRPVPGITGPTTLPVAFEPGH